MKNPFNVLRESTVKATDKPKSVPIVPIKNPFALLRDNTIPTAKEQKEQHNTVMKRPSSLYELFSKVEAAGCDLWLENDRLKHDLPSGDLLTEVLAMQRHIIRYLQIETQLKKTGWCMLARLKAYEFTLSARHLIYLFREDNDLWTVWRATYGIDKDGKTIPQPASEKTTKTNVTFLTAIADAHQYIAWYKKKVLNELWIPPDLGDTGQQQQQVQNG
jgi:hypothetical protein